MSPETAWEHLSSRATKIANLDHEEAIHLLLDREEVLERVPLKYAHGIRVRGRSPGVKDFAPRPRPLRPLLPDPAPADGFLSSSLLFCVHVLGVDDLVLRR